MNRKTASLAYPVNPLAAMRDLQELDAIEKQHATSSAESSTVAQPHGSERSSANVSADASAVALADSQKPAPKRISRRQPPEPTAGEPSSNPMADAVWTMLRQPYTTDARKGPFTVSTVKIPTEVWERLGWVATLTGQHKQEIITEALKAHFDAVLKARA